MTKKQLAAFAKSHLSSIRAKSGQVLYSGAWTLRPGTVYLLGHNPGGDPKDRLLNLLTVGRSIAALPKNSTNSYLDTDWVGRDVLQRRIIWLLEALGLNPRHVAASNLCFVRSKDARSSQMDRYAKLCWPVHEKILEIVRPRLVIVYGNSANSPYSFLANHYKDKARHHRLYRSGHGTWACRTFEVPGSFRVVGLPHLSRYDITAHPDVVRWIKSLI